MREVHIFDMDDTLLTTPTFADMIRNGSHDKVNDFLSNVKRGFMLFMSKNVDFKVSGDFIIMVDGSNGNPVPPSYLDIFEDMLERSEADIPNPETFKKQVGMKRSSLRDIWKCLDIKDRHIIVVQIRGFHADANTIGKGINDVIANAYANAQNKMIVTGRGKKLEAAITNRLEELGLHFPNQGLYCFPEDGTSIQQFKIDTILRSIEENGWEIVHFYEDREDWLNAAFNAVQQQYPNIEFVKHHITNVHDTKSL